MKLLVDNQLPPALARFIQSEFGCSAVHVADIELRDASDEQVWQYASETDSILVSKDDDFASMGLRSPTARLIWRRTGNCRKRFLCFKEPTRASRIAKEFGAKQMAIAGLGPFNSKGSETADDVKRYMLR